MDLARMAGLVSAGVICEIMNDDGTMARVPDLVKFCEEHKMKMVTVADLIRYRLQNERYTPPDRGVSVADGVRRFSNDRLRERGGWR